MTSSLTSCLPPGLSAISSLQETLPSGLKLADLMTSLDANLKSTFGVSALQDLAKYAERYDKVGNEPAPKKMKTEDSSPRVNGANQRNGGGNDSRTSKGAETSGSKSGLPVPGLVSADLLRTMNILENPNLLLPAHQSTKTTINTLAALLPQTSIFPAPAPAAHQHARPSVNKNQRNATRPDPPRVLQPQSVYSQSKNIYGKPTTHLSGDRSKDNKRSSPEIEILDLSRPSSGGRKEKSVSHERNDRLDLELLDLSTRRDITVSAVPKPGTSRNSSSSSSSKIPALQVNIKSADALSASGLAGSSSGHTGSDVDVSVSTAAVAAAAAAQGLNHLGLGLGSPLVPYLLPPHGSMKGSHHSPGPGSLPMFPYMDPTAIAAYYNSLISPPGMMPPTSSSGSMGNNAATAAAVAAQRQAAVHMAQLSSLSLGGLSGINPEALANLGMYKNFLPQGNLPAPHFLSDLMPPNPPSSK